MNHVSEWVSSAHPDKMCDVIVSHVLAKWIELYDKDVRFAMECLAKEDAIHLAGEITSKRWPTQFNIEQWVREAVTKIGYTRDYAESWPRGCSPCAEHMNVMLHITKQSKDISQGVDGGGWGDQGIFWGMATPYESCQYMPLDCWLARKIGMELPNYGNFGIDIKTLVEMDDIFPWKKFSKKDKMRVCVAVPTRDDDETQLALKVVSHICHAATGLDEIEITVNGTGRFVSHGTMADTGVTGRKLCVDLYGGNCEVGGGCMWGKDRTKADFLLNAYARKLAVAEAKKRNEAVKVRMSCMIGQCRVDVQVFDCFNVPLDSYSAFMGPDSVAEVVGDIVNRPDEMCMEGMPYAVV